MRALRLWIAISPPATRDTSIFAMVPATHAALRYRASLKRAGLTRRDLFASTAERRPMRVHDLRASFVTLALAAGRGAPTTELWVRDRTGHTPKQMETYRRWSRFALENEQGWFAPLDEAIPELAAFAKGGRSLLAGALVGHEVGHAEESSINSASATRAPCSVEGGSGRHHASKTPAPDAPGCLGEHGGPPDGVGVGHVLKALESLSARELRRVASRCRQLLTR